MTMTPVVSVLATTLASIAWRGIANWVLSRSTTHDLEDEGGRVIVEVKEHLSGARELLAAAAALAVECQRSPRVEQAYLVLWQPRTSLDRTRGEWTAFCESLRVEVATRLRLVCVQSSDDLLIPDDNLGRQLAHAVRSAYEGPPHPTTKIDRSYEVLKILSHRYVRGESAIKISELQRQTGLSHPSVARALKHLQKYLVRESDRSVRLGAWPIENWVVMRALAPKLRRTIAYTDATGRSIDLSRMLTRIKRMKAAAVAVGGVVGARFWQPDIDIDGTPRLDLSVHAPDGRANLGFVEKLDVALEPSTDVANAPLVVHWLVRADPLFTLSEDGLQIADPIEILLDLEELRFTEQIGAFRKHLVRAK